MPTANEQSFLPIDGWRVWREPDTTSPILSLFHTVILYGAESRNEASRAAPAAIEPLDADYAKTA